MVLLSAPKKWILTGKRNVGPLVEKKLAALWDFKRVSRHIYGRGLLMTDIHAIFLYEICISGK